MRIRHLTAVGLVGALALGTVVSASAGPLPIGTGLKAATSPATTEIYWRRGFGGYGPGIAFGLAAGALVGAAVASRPYYGYGPGYGYAPGYVYDAPVYAEPYAYAPVYPGYYGGYGYGGYGYGRCSTDEGYGRRRPCSGN